MEINNESVDSSQEANLVDQSEQYLTFMLDDEEYGIEIMRVQGIQGWTSVTPIPNTPTHILGVINLRGQIVPIIDLRLRFSLEKTTFSASTVVIIVKLVNDGKEKLMGIVVDGVSETYRFDNEKIQPPPELSNSTNTEFLKGLASIEDKLVILLDIDHIVDINELDDVPKSTAA